MDRPSSRRRQDAAAAGVETTPGARSFAIRLDFEARAIAQSSRQALLQRAILLLLQVQTRQPYGSRWPKTALHRSWMLADCAFGSKPNRVLAPVTAWSIDPKPPFEQRFTMAETRKLV
jgi:hypothetical protein